MAASVDIERARQLALEGLHKSGEEHKQWYLEQIAAALGVDIEAEHEKSLAREGFGEWQRGIAP